MIAATNATASGTGKHQVVVNPAPCPPVPNQLITAAAKIVGADWPSYRRFMCLYPIRSPAGGTQVLLLALDVARADAANALAFVHGVPATPNDLAGNIDPIPLPSLISPNGTVLGTLPVDFPSDPPATTEVLASDWRNNFPHQITLRVNDPTQDSAIPPPYCPPPLIWHETTKTFVQEAGNFYAACPRR